MKPFDPEDRAGAILLPTLIISALLLAAAFGWIPPASADEASDSGEVYVGEGCVRAGDVVVGDCEGGDGIGEETTSSPDAQTQEGGPPEETATLEATSPQETTSFEATYPKDTAPEGSVSREDAACPTEPSGETREARVERAVDGDTLEISEEVEGADRVRLIGIDSPEMNATEEDAESEPGAAEAAGFTAAALGGEDVVLELGEDPKDDYGRLLAYVWIDGYAGAGAEEESLWPTLKRMVGMEETELLNETLLAEGHAEALNIAPNDAYAACFEKAERRAESPDAADEQYGKQAFWEGNRMEGAAPEKTSTEAPENTASEDNAFEPTAPEPTMPEEGDDERTVSGNGPSGEPAREQYDESETPGRSAPEETTAPEEGVPETAPAHEWYEETTVEDESEEAARAPAPELTVSEETVQEETAEETAFATEAATEAEPAPGRWKAPESEVSRETEGEGPGGSDEEELEAQENEAYAPVEEQYGPPEDITEGPALTTTLPTAQTPEGSVPVLPDTGGASGLSLLAGALGGVCLVIGGCASALRGRIRAPEHHPTERR